MFGLDRATIIINSLRRRPGAGWYVATIYKAVANFADPHVDRKGHVILWSCNASFPHIGPMIGLLG